MDLQFIIGTMVALEENALSHEHLKTHVNANAL